MSNEAPEQEFWERADKVIALANEQCDECTVGEVSSSLLYATARFNAFNIASSSIDIEELKNDKDEAIRYLTEQYNKMLTENFDDHIENFHDYFVPADREQ
jgi:hypothetical protein